MDYGKTMKKLLEIRLTSTFFTLNVILLLLLGILAIYSTTYATSENEFLYRQLTWILLGLFSAAALSMFPQRFLSKYSKLILLLVFLPLTYLTVASLSIGILSKLTGMTGTSLARYMPMVVYSKGAARWLRLGAMTIQPSEFGKFAIILFLCTYYGMRDTMKIESLKEGFLIPLCYSAVLLVLIFLGKSMSNTIITATIVFSIMFLAGVRMKYLAFSAFLGIILVVLGISFSSYRRQRIINYIYKDQQVKTSTTGEIKADNHQLLRSICALGSGGLTGMGLGKGRLKNSRIPESQTDFIFAVIGEEFGFLGILFGLGLYLAFTLLAFKISRQCPNRQGALITMAVGIYILFQALYNLCVVCGLGPTTGVTAPLVSYGGSSIISVMMCVGLVLNICRSNYADTLENAIE